MRLAAVLSHQFTLSCYLLCVSAAGAETKALPEELKGSRGLCVVVGDAAAERCLSLAETSELVLYLQLADKADFDAASKAIDGAGYYGSRIFVARGPAARLHLADNLADYVIATGKSGLPEKSEILRVLGPRGTAVVQGERYTKPVPEGMDDWSHPYYRPHNNTLSEDKVIRAPYMTKFLANPRYAPGPQAYVLSGGRLFCAFGHVAFHERAEPYLNTLLCVNAFNGIALWRVPLPEGIMVDRNTIIASKDRLYFADHESCKIYDAATGERTDEIAVDPKLIGGTFWKWMALEGQTLYAVIGPDEPRGRNALWRRRGHGWAWDNVFRGVGARAYPWGTGGAALAIDLASKRVLWHHREEDPIDSRAVAMSEGRMYLLSHGKSLTCLDRADGKVVWRIASETAPDVFEAMGGMTWDGAQKPRRTRAPAGNPFAGWASSRYLRVFDKALYFGGPPVKRLAAVSARDGKLLWSTEDLFGYQILVRPDGVYALAGQGDQRFKWGARDGKIFALKTGEVLGDISPGRRACVPVTGVGDDVFCRAYGGTMRYDVKSRSASFLNPMRPSCFGGVLIGQGQLYWGPWQCDCNLDVFGLVSVASAGDFTFGQSALPEERLERYASPDRLSVEAIPGRDWPTLRGNNQRTTQTSVVIPASVTSAWAWGRPDGNRPTLSTAVGETVFLCGSDGIVRALDVETGRERWKVYTEGPIFYPPTFDKGALYVSSGDGWVYALDADSGAALWRFRGSPAERRIPVFGKLQSAWPAASGVLVKDGVAFFAAGMLDYDGTHVYALDAASGEIKWQNNATGHACPVPRGGVSVQGHLLEWKGVLYLAGGKTRPAARFDMKDGKLLGVWREKRDPGAAGSELLVFSPRRPLIGSPGQKLYQHPDFKTYNSGGWMQFGLYVQEDKALYILSSESGRKSKLMLLDRSFDLRYANADRYNEQAHWVYEYGHGAAFVVGANAAVVAVNGPRRPEKAPPKLVALALADGEVMWEREMPCAVRRWGLAVDRDGNVIVSLEDGRVMCLAAEDGG